MPMGVLEICTKVSVKNRIDSHLCGVAKSVLRLALCVVAESTHYCIVSLVLPLKLGRSRIVNPRSVMNCHSLSAPKALVKMSAV